MSAAPGTITHTQRRASRPFRNAAIAAGLILAVGVSSPAQANVVDARSTEPTPIVIGTGPHAVYVGPAPMFGGDPARGETDDSYHARTGRHLPTWSNAAVVDGAWWYGPAPVTGSDPALGETDDSYFARIGRHLPAR